MGKGPPERIHTAAFHPLGLAWEAGNAAYRRGHTPNDGGNPYTAKHQQHERDAWLAGFWFAHQRAVTGK